MGEPSDNQREVLDPLQLDRCPDCGYMLTGLPRQGVCPECGFAYDAGMVVLYGRPGGQHSNAATDGRVSWRSLLSVLVVGVLAVSPFALPRIHPALRWIPLPMFVPYGILLTMVLYRAWRTRRDDLRSGAYSQLRLCSQGFAQRDFIGPVQLHAWTLDLRIDLKIKGWSINLLERRWPASRRRLHVRILRWRGHFKLATMLVDFRIDCEQDTALRLQQHVERCCRLAMN